MFFADMELRGDFCLIKVLSLNQSLLKSYVESSEFTRSSQVPIILKETGWQSGSCER
jgi:hypothetical protein